MSERENELLPASALGCVFCKTGSEEATACMLNATPHMIRALVPKKLQHHSERGVKSIVKRVLFPGYVFFQAEERWIFARRRFHADSVLRLLCKDGDWRLRGDDEKYVRFILEHDGLLEMSKAYQVGTRVVFKSGPLKELEGIVTKVDRHNRNGMVTLNMFGRETSVWLPFEMLEEKNVRPFAGAEAARHCAVQAQAVPFRLCYENPEKKGE